MFKQQNFTSHSGLDLTWKVDCDCLSDDDLACLAAIKGPQFLFSHVYGVPRGGMRFAKALQPYAYTSVDKPPSLLIVDDVLTTGGSMIEYRKKMQQSFAEIHGLVIFNRSKLDIPWISSIWRLE